MRWTMGLVAFFVAVFAMNGVFLYLAVAGREPVAESYEREAR